MAGCPGLHFRGNAFPKAGRMDFRSRPPMTSLGRFPLSFLLAAAVGRAGEAPAGAAIRQELRSLATTGTLLHVAAHPDDENTHLITYFARARGYRTAYLSLTRGDGGQNEIGPEFDEKLGVARTQELLAARRLDGGQQFFTRAIDFGYSKSAEETLRFWDRREVLGDVVRVIRQFRPDVIVTRFSPTGGGTHGHHTASGQLGVEAFKLAGDPRAYPEQIAQGLAPWQPRRVVLNSGGFGRGGAPAAKALRLDIGGVDPATGEGLGTIANRSRARHITQGFGSFGGRSGGSGPNEQSFLLLGGEPATQDLFDGVDVTWGRYGAAGLEVGAHLQRIEADFRPEAPAALVPALLEVRRRLAALPPDALVRDRRAQLERLIQTCLGLQVAATAEQPEVAPGGRIEWRLTARVAAELPVRWVATELRTRRVADRPVTLAPGREAAQEVAETVPADAALTHPYWLREDGAAGIFRVDEPALIGRAEDAAAFPVRFLFDIAGHELAVTVDGEALERTPRGAERRRRVLVVSPLTLRFASGVEVFAPGATKDVRVEVTAGRGGAAGRLEPEVPAGWRVDPAAADFRLEREGVSGVVKFSVTAPASPGAGWLAVHADVGGRRYWNQRVEIRYDHLPPQVLQPRARARAVVVDVAVRGRTVGYLPGAGDATAAALAQLGYQVRTLRGADLTPAGLRGIDAVVIGVRAFNEREDLAAHLPGLWAWVEQGGTAIAQYNRPNGLAASELGPYPLSIQGPAPQLRVTDETAPVEVLAPSHPVVTSPNRIGPEDFAGWVQERGAYFPSSWDRARWEPVLAMGDPGETPLRSSVLVARHGRGYYVYTGLAFFRQLPAGVPGAYRLFANLVSLGK